MQTARQTRAGLSWLFSTKAHTCWIHPPIPSGAHQRERKRILCGRSSSSGSGFWEPIFLIVPLAQAFFLLSEIPRKSGSIRHSKQLTTLEMSAIILFHSGFAPQEAPSFGPLLGHTPSSHDSLTLTLLLMLLVARGVSQRGGTTFHLGVGRSCAHTAAGIPDPQCRHTGKR